MDKQSSNKCKLCLTASPDFIRIHSIIGQELKIDELLAKYFWFDQPTDNEFENNDIICKLCWSQVKDFHQFYKKIETIHGRCFQTEQIFIKTDEDDDPIILLKSEGNDIKNASKEAVNSNITIKEELFVDVLEKEDMTLFSDDDDGDMTTLTIGENNELPEINEEVTSNKKTCKRKGSKAENRRKKKPISMEVIGKKLIEKAILDHGNLIELKCCTCDTSFTSKRSLKTHMTLKHIPKTEMPYKCAVCSEVFTNKKSLMYHSNKHLSERPFSCDECDRRFTVKTHLTAHKKTVHTRDNNHICDICAKVFTTRANYQVHYVNTHTEVEKVQCQLCKVWLKHKIGLHKHMLRHEEQKKEIVCTMCTRKDFPSYQALRDHMKRTHVERTFKCTICEKAFKTSISLKEHTATHTGELLYKCDYCSMACKSNASMYTHRKKAHPEEYNKLKENQRLNIKTN